MQVFGLVTWLGGGEEAVNEEVFWLEVEEAALLDISCKYCARSNKAPSSMVDELAMFSLAGPSPSLLSWWWRQLGWIIKSDVPLAEIKVKMGVGSFAI